MEKRGQVTVFVVMGLLILIVVAFVFMVKLRIAQHQRREGTQEHLFSSKTSLRGYTEECFDIAMKDIIKRLYENGGYLERKDIITYEEINASCLYCNYINNILSRKEVEEIISEEIEEGSVFSECISNYDSFEKQGYFITQGVKSANTLIEDRKVIVTLNFPVTIKKGEVVEKISDVSNNYQEDLGLILDAAREIINRNVRESQLEFGDYAKKFPGLKLEGQYFLDDYEFIRIYTNKNKIFRFFMNDPLKRSNVPDACCVTENGCFERKICDNIKMNSCKSLPECSLPYTEIEEGKSCSFNFNENYLNLNHGDKMCIQDESVYGQHYLVYCENGEVKSEALGNKRVCVDGIKRKNEYELCKTCGGPIQYLDLTGFAENKRGNLCTVSKCESLGDCQAVTRRGNVDCYPKYRPGVDECSICGEGGDANANICDIEECNKVGDCNPEIKQGVNKVILEQSKPSLCFAVIEAVAKNNLDEDLLKGVCDVEDYGIYYLLAQAKEYSCKKGMSKIVNECKKCDEDFNQCTPERCSYLGMGCKYKFNNTYVLCELDTSREELVISVDLGSYNWENKNINVGINSDKATICKYSESLITEWGDMITIGDGNFKSSHNENIILEIRTPSNIPWTKIVRFVCMDENGNFAEEEVTIEIPAKTGELKIIKISKGINIEVDGETSSCKFKDITKELNKGDLTALNLAPDTEFNVCNYISTLGVTKCTQTLASGGYFLIQCEDLTGGKGEIYAAVS